MDSFYNKLIKIITFISLFFCFFPSNAHNKQKINFYEAYKIALANNPRIGISFISIEQANAEIIETKGMQWPHVSLEFNGTRSDNPLNVFGYRLSQGNVSFADFGAQQFTGPNSLNVKPTALNHPGYYNNFYTAFKLVMPVYSGGKIQAQRAKAYESLVSAQNGNTSTKNQLAFEILQAYEGTLIAMRLINIAKENVNAAKEYLNITIELLNQAITLESDVLLAKSYLNAAETALYDANIQMQNQLDQFRVLLGCPNSSWEPDVPVVLNNNFFNSKHLIEEAIKRNAQLHIAESKIKSQKAEILVSKSAYKPQINLLVRQMWNGPNLGSGLPSNVISLGLDWKLFTGGEIKGAVQKSFAEAKKATFELDEQRNNLRLHLQQIIRSEEQAKNNYTANKTIATKANHILISLRQRFGRGLAPLSSLLDSQIKLTQAEAQAEQAIYAQKLAKARFLMLMNQLEPISSNEK